MSSDVIVKDGYVLAPDGVDVVKENWEAKLNELDWQIRYELTQVAGHAVKACYLFVQLREEFANYGAWGKWLEDKPYGRRTADRYVQVGKMLIEEFGERQALPNASISALLELTKEDYGAARSQLLREAVGNEAEYLTTAAVRGVVAGLDDSLKRVKMLPPTASEGLRRYVIEEDVDPEVVPVLAKMEANYPAEFDDVMASGSISDKSGNSIALTDANKRDVQAAYDQTRFEFEQRKRITIVLKGERPMSLNSFFSRGHWTKRKKEQDRVHQLVQDAIAAQGIRVGVYDQPVRIWIKAYFKNRPLDASNIVGKVYEDALRGVLIVDDNWRYVQAITLETKVDASDPRVEIVIVPQGGTIPE